MINLTLLLIDVLSGYEESDLYTSSSFFYKVKIADWLSAPLYKFTFPVSKRLEENVCTVDLVAISFQPDHHNSITKIKIPLEKRTQNLNRLCH
jgi:hypothetical protein